jgi:hypothetical protein
MPNLTGMCINKIAAVLEIPAADWTCVSRNLIAQVAAGFGGLRHGSIIPMLANGHSQ